MRKLFVIFLILTIISCDDDETHINVIACFNFLPSEIKVGDEVTFSNCSDNALSYKWDFGDWISSTETEPKHIYNESGNYTVSLIAFNGEFYSTTYKILKILDTCALDMSDYDSSFGIDYDSPETYLVPGDMSDLSDTYLNEIINEIGTLECNINGIKSVFNWFISNFTFENAGGSMIGQKTIDELYVSKVFYGCHSASLILSSVLREFGFPTTMIETADVEWAYDYSSGEVSYFAGHVLSEVYVDEKWILLDINGKYVEDYNYLDPYLSIPDPSSLGLFVYIKGKDIWDYGVMDEQDTHNMMINFVDNLVCFEPMFSTNNYLWKNL